MNSTLGEDLKNVLQEVKTTIKKYRLKKFKSNISKMILDIVEDIDYLLFTNETSSVDYLVIKDHKTIVKKLELIRQNMFALSGKIGFNDYNRFEELCEELDAHMVAYTLKNA